MDMTPFQFSPPPSNPFSDASAKLRAAGHSLEPSYIPGLTWVSGPLAPSGYEATIGQVLDMARQC